MKGTTMPENKNLTVWELLDMVLFLPEDENIHEK
jgi:hypothetical protein